jgi:hypothetical protein
MLATVPFSMLDETLSRLKSKQRRIELDSALFLLFGWQLLIRDPPDYFSLLWILSQQLFLGKQFKVMIVKAGRHGTADQSKR